ncbi:MAG: hypothetical protein M1838_001474 [Thelocarpon superellum]|nr:MAG: hypothetical protein M1838_001474 [Thelocarpon superellum]
MSDDNRRTISRELALKLEQRGGLSPVVDNKRKLSLAAIIPPTSAQGSRSSSGTSANIITSASFHASSINEDVTEVDIPADLESKETYMFMGFDDTTATMLWDKYTTACDDPEFGDEYDFCEFAVDHVITADHPDATSEEDDWDAYMRAVGIDDKLREAILLPEYEDIRYTATCKFWLLETINRTWDALESLEVQLSQTTTRREQREAAEQPAGVQDINLGLLAAAPGDFSGITPVLYTTPQREIADQYAAWLKKKVLIDDVVILQFAVPNEWLRQFHVEYLWYGGDQDGIRPADAWRKLVWASRRVADEISPELEKLSSVDVLIGHIASGKHKKFKKMPDYTDIKRSQLLRVKIDGEWKDGIQWAFMTPSVRYRFKERFANDVYIHWIRSRRPPEDGN